MLPHNKALVCGNLCEKKNFEKSREKSKISVLTSVTAWDGRVVLKLSSGILPRFPTHSVAKIHWLRRLSSCERREWERLSLKYVSPLKKGKSHAICLLSETLSPPIEKFFPKDLQLLRPPALLSTTNKPQNSRGAERGNYKDFLNLAKSHRSSVACWCNIAKTVFCGKRERPNISDQQTNIRTS